MIVIGNSYNVKQLKAQGLFIQGSLFNSTKFAIIDTRGEFRGDAIKDSKTTYKILTWR